MRRVLSLLVLSFVLSFVFPGIATAQVPARLAYQGLLTTQTGAAIADGSYRVTFRLYAEAGTEALYEETQTVLLAGGLFSTLIGKEALLDLPFDEPYVLTVEVEGEPESAPVPLATSPYALKAKDVADGAVVRSISGLKDEVEIVAGEGIVIRQQENRLVISALTAPVGLRGAEPGIGPVAPSLLGPGGSNVGLDAAYDAGRIITADDGALEIQGAGTATSLKVLNGDLLFEDNTGGKPNIRFKTSGGAIGVQEWRFNLNSIGYLTLRDNTGGANVFVLVPGAQENLLRLTGGAVEIKGVLSRVDGQPLEVQVGGARVMRYEPAANPLAEGPNVVGGASVNSVGVGVVGATISGGGAPDFFSTPKPNQVLADYGTVGGGFGNTANGNYATVGGGDSSEASGGSATVGGGWDNVADGDRAVVGGGEQNTASGPWATVGGGKENTALGLVSTVGGGEQNTASYSYATVGGGVGNEASGSWATVGGGQDNTASDDNATVGGGNGNTASDAAATVGGGLLNTASGLRSTTGGGEQNTAGGSRATVGGGEHNRASGNWATAGGGRDNTAPASYATVPGGRDNQAGGQYSFAAGRRAQVRDDATVGGGDTDGDEGTFVWADTEDADFISTGPDQFLIRAAGGVGIGTSSPTTTLALNAGLGGKDVGLTQGLLGGVHALELTTTDDDFDQTTRLLFRGIKDAADIEFYRGARGAETLSLFIEGDNGNVGIGTSTPTEALEVNGNVKADNVSVTSDGRYKRDVATLTGALTTVARLRGVRYRWKQDQYPEKDFEAGEQIGFIAQELRGVLPEVVKEGSDGMLSVRYSQVIPLLVEAIKEQQAEIDGQQAEYEQQQAEIEALRAQVAQVEQVQAAMARQQAEMAALRALVEAAVGAGAGPASSPTGETGTTAPQD